MMNELPTDRPVTNLFLHEEVLLLALRDDEGTFVSGAMYSHAIAGGILAELMLSKRIDLDPVKPKRKIIDVLSKEPIGDPVLDECLFKIATAKRRGSMQTWVARFTNRELQHRVAAGLVDLGILKADKDKVLWIFDRRIYPEIDHAPEQQLIERLEHAVFTDDTDISPRTVILLALAHHSGLLSKSLPKKELRKRKKRIDQIVSGDVVGQATKEAIQAVQAAIVVACTVPAICAAAT
ncbi:MAG: GPP34 family phosphoprotein [Planctomycetes bacterium]|nr:GPP34 family phosphoprotein [Planctomycetota bacterium]